MKKLGLLFIGTILAFSVNAQKFAFVDTEYILDRYLLIKQLRIK